MSTRRIFTFMTFPLNDLELGLFFAVIAMILLVTSGLLPSGKEKRTVLINVKKLKKAAIVVSILFMINIFLRISIWILIT
jgi:uncharacterized membrane protein YvlD (DUF360 family)